MRHDQPVITWSLRFMIPALLFLFALGWGMVTLNYDTYVETAKLEEAERRDLVQEMTDLQRRTEHLLSREDEGGMQLEIPPMASDPDLRYAFLSDEQDRILYAIRQDWVGETAQRVFPSINTQLIAQAKRTPSGVVLFSADHNSVMGYYPVILGVRRGDLRSNRIGVLFMLHDLRHDKFNMLRKVQSNVLRSTLILAAWAGLLALIFHFTLTRRVVRVVVATERLASGDLRTRTGLTGGDELARIGHAFDQMAHKIEVDSLHLQESQQQLQQLNKVLEERVQERTAELEAANKELESFSYSVSHDLRAPLRGIDGFSQALLTKHADQLDERGRHYLQRVRVGTQRMGRLIDDLLDLSRVTRSELRHDTVDLSSIARSITAEFHQTQPLRKVVFHIQDALQVQGDARLLHIVLQNLLSNAWKFTSKHAQATIEFGQLQQQGEEVYFVRDDGNGFDMHYVDKLFGAFQRLHSEAEFEGTGIGLATVQRVLHRHGGRIWAEGAVEQGATFYFTVAPSRG